MSVSDRRADFSKQQESFFDCQSLVIAVGGDDLAFHIFHRDKRQAIRGCAAIEQPGNVWMIERGKNIALHHKTPDDGFCVHAALDNLESYLLMKSIALGQIHGPHPTAADFTHNPVGTDLSSRSDFIAGH